MKLIKDITANTNNYYLVNDDYNENADTEIVITHGEKFGVLREAIKIFGSKNNAWYNLRK